MLSRGTNALSSQGFPGDLVHHVMTETTHMVANKIHILRPDIILVYWTLKTNQVKLNVMCV